MIIVITEREEIDMAVIHLSKIILMKKYWSLQSTRNGRFLGNIGGPCKTMAPIVEERSEERTDIKACKIDVDQEPELAKTVSCKCLSRHFWCSKTEKALREIWVGCPRTSWKV